MKLKRLTACAVISAAMLMQITAFADETNEKDYTDNYFAVDNVLELDTDDDSLKTVLIVKVDDTNDEEYQDTDIVYVNQSSSGFNTSTAFMIKADPEAGLYKVILGGGASASVNYFNIGMTLKEADVDMDSGAAEDGYIESYTSNGSEVYKKGFLKTVTADECNAYKSIKLVENQVVGAWSLTGGESSTVTSGEGDVLMGVQIYNIPDGDTADNLKVYLSTDEISTAEVETE